MMCFCCDEAVSELSKHLVYGLFFNVVCAGRARTAVTVPGIHVQYWEHHRPLIF